MTGAVWTAILFGLANLVLAVAAWFRAGRATQLAERSERRAIDAEARAEEAHTILKDRFADDRERAQADLDAPGIADRWIGQLKVTSEDARAAKRTHAVLEVAVTTLAERKAIEILRAMKGELFIREINLREKGATITRSLPRRQITIG